MQKIVPDIVELGIDQEGFLVGTFTTGAPARPAVVHIDDKPWATVPSFPSPYSGGRSFRCGFPPVSPGHDGSCKASVVDVFGDPLASIEVPARAGVRNMAGVDAAAVLELCDRPFYAVPYLSFDGSTLTVSGSHLPPRGDPSALTVEFGPGVAHEFRYPLEARDWGAHFWYWPNSTFSDFQLTIDLAASNIGSDPFTFRFRYRDPGLDALPEPYGRIWLPRDLGVAVGFPTDLTQLTRVQTWSDARTATLVGFNHYRAVQVILARYGVLRESCPVLLDWGCGHGRVARHFVREWPGATIVGIDVDAENAAWASQNLSPGRFVTSPLMPPCPLSDASVDAAFSISVMTHLPPPVQRAWLADLARVVRPDGIVLMSFGGPSAAAWSSVWNGPDYFETFLRDGYHADQVDVALNGKIEDPNYYRNVAQSHEHVRRNWSEHFDVVDILEEGVGNLDVAVLRRRKRS